MPLSVTRIRELMNKPECIRNLSVIAHVDHGKTTLTDSLIAKAGIIADSRSGDARMTDGKPAERERGITIESTSVSLYYERVLNADSKEAFLMNLIDSPGHIDFSSEVTAALRVTDGALVVVDCIEGVCVQTETVLRQAISERIRPVLFLNKLDRVFLEQQKSLEETYTTLRNSVESVNVVCQTYRDDRMGNVELNPSIGNVGFGSGLHAWGFSLSDFAQMYAQSRFGLSPSKMMKKLWGDNYWNSASKSWSKVAASEQRGFCEFVLKPVKVLIDSIMAGDRQVYVPIIDALGLRLSKKDIEEAGKKREKGMVKLVMRSWLAAGDTLLDMIADHLPSPLTAQAYRVENLYSGPADSPEIEWIAKCDRDAPLSMYVSKMVKAGPSRMIGFGRVFSGTVETGQEVRILGPDYEHGGKRDLHIKKIQRVVLMMANKTEAISDVPCGNVCGLVGVDQYLENSGTITSSDSFHPFHTMKFSVASVVRVAVEAKKASDLPKLVDGLRKLRQMNASVQTSVSKTGQHIVAGAGELHLEVCLNDLREEMAGAEIVVSEPVVTYTETITMRSRQAVWAKSPNKLNRLQATAEPLDGRLIAAVERGDISLARSADMKQFSANLRDNYGWQSSDARRIWSFGCPPDGIANCVVDSTKGTAYLTEIRDHVRTGFMQVTESSVLSGEALRGVRFDLVDAKVHSDSAHRSAAQIIPATKKVLFGCVLASGGRLCEPMYTVDITVPRDCVSDVFSTLSTVRGITQSVTDKIGTPLTQISAHLPVSESFGFTQLLRRNTGGKAFPQMRFSHWQMIESDPLSVGTHAHSILLSIRERKGMKIEVPSFTDYSDRL